MLQLCCSLLSALGCMLWLYGLCRIILERLRSPCSFSRQTHQGACNEVGWAEVL